MRMSSVLKQRIGFVTLFLLQHRGKYPFEWESSRDSQIRIITKSNHLRIGVDFVNGSKNRPHSFQSICHKLVATFNGGLAIRSAIVLHTTRWNNSVHFLKPLWETQLTISSSASFPICIHFVVEQWGMIGTHAKCFHKGVISYSNKYRPDYSKMRSWYWLVFCLGHFNRPGPLLAVVSPTAIFLNPRKHSLFQSATCQEKWFRWTKVTQKSCQLLVFFRYKKIVYAWNYSTSCRPWRDNASLRRKKMAIHHNSVLRVSS